MFVNGVLVAARTRLVTLADSAALLEAAKLLGEPDTDLVVVCGPDGLLAGVVTSSNVVEQMGRCQGCGCTTAAALVMTRDVVVCHLGDPLDEVWSRMKARGLKNLPVLDEARRPLGVLNARDVLQALLLEVENEESLLRDYVMNTGYR
ncbi:MULTISPECIES: CBS domain-containing protein [unclassified Luteimonas]